MNETESIKFLAQMPKGRANFSGECPGMGEGYLILWKNWYI